MENNYGIIKYYKKGGITLNNSNHSITLTKARLNTSPFIEKSITSAIAITNNTDCGIYGLSLTDSYDMPDKYLPDKDSAVLYYEGRRYPLEANTNKNKITLKGIFVPPRENVYIFYTLS